MRNSPILLLACAVAIIVVLCHIGVALWAENEFTQPEGVVATQILSLAEKGSLYYDLKQYPYTVCAYMPIFYLTVAGMNHLGVPVLTGGRILSILALSWLFFLIWKILILYTEDPFCSMTGVALAGMTQLLLGWGIVGQVDTLAVALTLTAFYQYSRYRVLGENCLDRAAFFAVAGLFTKQTVLSAPLVIFLVLLLESPKQALRFATIVGGIGGAMVLTLNTLMHGRFLENTVFGNMNPIALYKLQVHLEYMAIALLPLIPVVAVGVKQAIRSPMRAAFLYLGIALTVLLLTAGKVGSDSNYQIETAVVLILCACLSLHLVNFYGLSLGGSKKWVTLLMLPLGLYALQNLRISGSGLLERIVREQSFRAQIQGLDPFLRSTGLLLSADSNLLVRAKRRFEVEPLIYRMLVEAGRIDDSIVLQDIKNAKFQTVILYEDLAQITDEDPEIPRLPRAQTDAIRNRYRFVKHLPGPYLGGLYVYQPAVGLEHGDGNWH